MQLQFSKNIFLLSEMDVEDSASAPLQESCENSKQNGKLKKDDDDRVILQIQQYFGASLHIIR